MWVVMPFGVKNGPPTYQRVVAKTFHEYIDVLMKNFLDNFIIFSGLSTHFKKLHKCFLKCRKFGINLNLKQVCIQGVFKNHLRFHSVQRRQSHGS